MSKQHSAPFAGHRAAHGDAKPHRTPKPDAGGDSYLDIECLVRSIQRSEGQAACFRRHPKNCRQKDCPWFDYC